MSKKVQYGQVAGPEVIIEMPVGASEVFKYKGGCFVEPDGSGRIEVCDDGDNTPIGWALSAERTASSTEGADKVGVNVSYDAVFEMPAILADGTVPSDSALAAAVGETCDIKVSSNVQYAVIDASSDDILLIVGYKVYGSTLGQKTVLVQRVPKNISYTGVA